MSTLPRFRDPYNYDTDLVSFSSGLDCSNDPSRAQQHMKDETDINRLVSIYARTGVVPGADLPAMEFVADDIYDYQTAMNAVIEAQKSFMSLPSALRERFHNNPAHLLEFVSDSRNREEAEKLGLTMRKIPESRAAAAPADVSQETPPVKE